MNYPTDRPFTNEQRYQAIKLWNSGKISLTELKALFRVVSAVAHKDFSRQQDIQSVLDTMARIDKLKSLTETRDIARQRAIMKLKPKPRYQGTREDAISKFVTGYKGALPHNWSRYGPLVAQTDRYNPPRPYSSRDKIQQTRYVGFKEFNKRFDNFMKSLLQLTKNRKEGGNIRAQGKKALKSIKVSATAKY
tara:strand:- start:377 stop:952 length:576 start_codon:yes stop_codon:yes gene_type:complete